VRRSRVCKVATRMATLLKMATLRVARSNYGVKTNFKVASKVAKSVHGAGEGRPPPVGGGLSGEVGGWQRGLAEQLAERW
jgi:hypothetical protein